MSVITFDTLKFVKELESAGVPAVQAEAQARALARALDTNLAELATKGDIREVRVDLARVETKLDTVRIDLQRDIHEMELRLTIKLGVFLVAAAGVFGALVKLL